MFMKEKYRKKNFWLSPEIFQWALKIKACLQIRTANGEWITQVQHQMFKTIHNPVNSSVNVQNLFIHEYLLYGNDF